MAAYLAADRQTGRLPAMWEPRHGTTETLDLKSASIRRSISTCLCISRMTKLKWREWGSISLKLTRFRGARQAFNGGFSDAQDASALFT
jgi:hypothetical protein